MDEHDLPVFTDHAQEHDEGRCVENCPWCLDDQELGGEGGGA